VFTQYLTAVAVVGAAGFLAEVDSFAPWAPLINMGGVGAVLVWFLWKADPRMRAIESSVDRNTQSILILLLEIDRTSPQAKEQAQAVLADIKKARKARGESEE
jgi:hypothetical protein